MIICKHAIFLCLGAWKYAPVTPPFFLRHECPITGKPEGRCLPLRITPLRQTPPGTARALKFSENWNDWGVNQTKTVPPKKWEAYNLGARSTFFTQFQRTKQLQNTGWLGFLNLPGDFCWLDLPQWATAVLWSS